MQILTEKAVLVCGHRGKVQIAASQELVKIEGIAVLVERDPEGKTIGGCPNYGPSIKPCTSTLAVQKGYSSLIGIMGKRLCLDTVEGLTDGTPPGTVKYKVVSPGQEWIRGDA